MEQAARAAKSYFDVTPMIARKSLSDRILAEGRNKCGGEWTGHGPAPHHHMSGHRYITNVYQ